MSGLFDSVNVGVSTKYGSLSLAGGRVNIDPNMGGSAAQPTPLQPTLRQQGSGIAAWIAANKTKALAIGVGLAVGLYLLFRR